MTNVLAAFPNLRQDIISEVEKFTGLLKNSNTGFPYQKLRNHTAHRCHRYKQLEKNIFQSLKETDASTLSKIRAKLAEVMSSFAMHLETLEQEGIGHEKPGEGRILDNRLKFKELSDPENIEINKAEEEKNTGNRSPRCVC